MFAPIRPRPIIPICTVGSRREKGESRKEKVEMRNGERAMRNGYKGAHAPRVLAMTPRRRGLLYWGRSEKVRFGEGAETSTRGACAPQREDGGRRPPLQGGKTLIRRG